MSDNDVPIEAEAEAERIEDLVRQSLNLPSSSSSQYAEEGYKTPEDGAAAAAANSPSPPPAPEGQDLNQSSSSNMAVQSTAAREYLNRVLPVVKKGLVELARERPDKPLKFLSEFLAARSATEELI